MDEFTCHTATHLMSSAVRKVSAVPVQFPLISGDPAWPLPLAEAAFAMALQTEEPAMAQLLPVCCCIFNLRGSFTYDVRIIFGILDPTPCHFHDHTTYQ